MRIRNTAYRGKVLEAGEEVAGVAVVDNTLAHPAGEAVRVPFIAAISKM